MGFINSYSFIICCFNTAQLKKSNLSLIMLLFQCEKSIEKKIFDDLKIQVHYFELILKCDPSPLQCITCLSKNKMKK